MREDVLNQKDIWFPSAISRYLVSNQTMPAQLLCRQRRFHPLYRGTWFPTRTTKKPLKSSIRFPSAISRYLVSNTKAFKAAGGDICFHPLYRGTWFPTHPLVVVSGFSPDGFPSAISRYLVSNVPKSADAFVFGYLFPSAISRYLVSNEKKRRPVRGDVTGFHPLYRGTWFPTAWFASLIAALKVSIRYIAVLGFQLRPISF